MKSDEVGILYEKYSDIVFCTALMYLKNQEDAYDIVHNVYEKLLRKYPDVVTVKDVVTLTGYTLTTVHNWCSRGSLKAFQKGLKFCIPKIFLVDFFCSLTFRSITRKSLWHIQTLNEFSRKMRRK